MVGINHPLGWKPVRHQVFRDSTMAEVLHQEGLTVESFLSAEQIEALRALYQASHTLSDEQGGMFYSLYSQDLAYREKIHQEVHQILKPTLEHWFKGYKNVINSFVVKLPGKASEFAIHQDTTALDETKFSPLSVWIPLWDVTPENGAMCMVPGSHKLFSPYRGISFPFPFQGANQTVRDYLEPVPVKAGEAVLFDPRVLHNSLPNLSDKPRIALICGIFPQEADFNICFKESPDSPIEIWQQEDDFLLKYPNFLHHCHDRPVSGKIVQQVEDRYPNLNDDSLKALLTEAGIEPRYIIPPPMEDRCNMIAEPDNSDRAPIVPFEEVVSEAPAAQLNPPKKGFWQRLFGKAD